MATLNGKTGSRVASPFWFPAYCLLQNNPATTDSPTRLPLQYMGLEAYRVRAGGATGWRLCNGDNRAVPQVFAARIEHPDQQGGEFLGAQTFDSNTND